MAFANLCITQMEVFTKNEYNKSVETQTVATTHKPTETRDYPSNIGESPAATDGSLLFSIVHIQNERNNANNHTDYGTDAEEVRSYVHRLPSRIFPTGAIHTPPFRILRDDRQPSLYRPSVYKSG